MVIYGGYTQSYNVPQNNMEQSGIGRNEFVCTFS